MPIVSMICYTKNSWESMMILSSTMTPREPMSMIAQRDANSTKAPTSNLLLPLQPHRAELSTWLMTDTIRIQSYQFNRQSIDAEYLQVHWRILI